MRLLTYNLMLIPKSVSSETFVHAPCLFHNERVAAMFDFGFLDDFDIVCVQECFDGLPGSLKEQFILYAAKAGFVHLSSSSLPQWHNATSCCGGEIIFSRFPIVRKAERKFSYCLFGDAEASVGVVYAEISIRAPNCPATSYSTRYSTSSSCDIETADFF